MDTRLYKFKDVVGNVTTVKLLKSALKNQPFPKFTILAGIPGTGKSTCAEVSALSLICTNPVDGEPCLECNKCLVNLKALQSQNPQTHNLAKKNLGKLNSRKDVLDLIKEIFTLESPIGNNVYILEEAHVLSKQDQTALLEEIDRLRKNIYIILCTTKLYSLIPELRSRAIVFNFNRLNKNESQLLFDRTCKQLGIQSVGRSVAEMVIKKTRGVPRDMIELTRFIHNTQPTEQEIAKHLGMIGSDIFTAFLETMQLSMADTVNTLNNLLEQYTHDIILDQFKNYFVDVLFYITGGIQGDLTRADIIRLKRILQPNTTYKICKVLESAESYNTSESDFKLLIVRIRQLMQKKDVTNIMTENSSLASRQQIESKKLNQEYTETKRNTTGTIKKLNDKDFENFFKENKATPMNSFGGE